MLMLPLETLHPRRAGGFRFTAGDAGLSFDEVASPSLMRFSDWRGPRDLPLHGRLGIDLGSGRLLSASLVANSPDFEISVDVRYAEDPAVGLLVPVEMHERYQRAMKPKDDCLEVSTTFDTFRRFQVTVDEKIDLPR